MNREILLSGGAINVLMFAFVFELMLVFVFELVGWALSQNNGDNREKMRTRQAAAVKMVMSYRFYFRAIIVVLKNLYFL